MSEDIKDYEITPEDLGCLGEKEIDDGVKEEAVESGETKTPAPKSFKHIPFEKKQKARKIYDGFAVKDMSFEDFCIELYALESPALMQADLRSVITQKEDGHRVRAGNMYRMKQSMN